MIKLLVKKKYLIMAFWFLAIPGINAQAAGFYTGASFGQSSADYSLSKSVSVGDDGYVNSSIKLDDNDFGFKVFGGYNFNQYFGVELAYVDLGKTKAKGKVKVKKAVPNAINKQVNRSATFQASGFAMAGVFRYPLDDKFAVFGKLGAVMYELDIKIANPGAGGLTNVELLALVTAGYKGGDVEKDLKADNDGVELMFGLGAEYKVLQDMGIRFEWERYDMEDVDINLFSIGFTYHF